MFFETAIFFKKTEKTFWLSIVLLAVCSLGAFPPAYAITPRNGRLLGIDVGNSNNATHDQALVYAKNAGLEVTELPLAWDLVESANATNPGGTTPGAYTDAAWTFADYYFSTNGVSLIVNLDPIDTNNNRIPADLKALPLDDPNVISRYQQVTNYVLGHFHNTTLTAFSVGNEVDGYLSGTQWAQYTTFFQAAIVYIHLNYPGVHDVGVKATFNGLTVNQASQLYALNSTSDAILVTYYPINGNFTVKNPSCVGPDFTNLTNIYSGRPIFFAEAGYQSSTNCASTEDLQATFVNQIFNAWDQHASQISLVNFYCLHDLSQAAVDAQCAYYGFSTLQFQEYLRTLGLRTYNGQDKPAFTALKTNAAAHGWFTDYTPTVTPSATLTATVTPSLTSLASISSDPTPSIDWHGNKVVAYPNPGKGKIIFILNINGPTTIEISIYNIAGERVAKLKDTCSSASNQIIWNSVGIPPGIYWAQILRDGNKFSQLKLALVH